MNATRWTLWAVAAVAAVGATTAAVTVANAGGGGDDVLSQDQVAAELAGEPAPSAAVGTARSRAPSSPPVAADGAGRTFRLDAGQLVVRCDSGLAWLDSWSPNPGYRADDVVRGPAVAVRFESDLHDDVVVAVTCIGDEPNLVQVTEPDDHGGDDDGDDDDDDDDGGGGGDDHGGSSGRGGDDD